MADGRASTVHIEVASRPTSVDKTTFECSKRHGVVLRHRRFRPSIVRFPSRTHVLMQDQLTLFASDSSVHLLRRMYAGNTDGCAPIDNAARRHGFDIRPIRRTTVVSRRTSTATLGKGKGNAFNSKVMRGPHASQLIR
jgi:hypothetical protein